MPDPIPRNRSALGPATRRPERKGVWPGRLFRRPRGNPGQPPPRRPRHAARQGAWPGRLFRRPRGNAGQPRPPRSQPRHAARQETRPGRLFRRPQSNAGQPEPPPPRTPTQPRTEVVVGVIILAVAVLAGIVVLRLLPPEPSSASPSDPAVSDRADVPAAGGGNPGPASGQLIAPPGALAGIDHHPTREGEADLGPRVDSLSVDLDPRRGGEPSKPGHAEQAPLRRQQHLPRKPDAHPPPGKPDRPPDNPQSVGQHRGVPNVIVPPPAGTAPQPQQVHRTPSSAGGQQHVNRPTGGQGPIASLWHLFVGLGTDEKPVQSR